MKTHLRRTNTTAPLCGALPGYYAPIRVTDERAKVTCKRCSLMSKGAWGGVNMRRRVGAKAAAIKSAGDGA